MFSVINYQFCKITMKNSIESIDHGIWDATVSEPYTPKYVFENK